MAYISKEEVKVIREEIKKNFPTKDGYKFSIRGRDASAVYVDILQSPFPFLQDSQRSYQQITNYNLKKDFGDMKEAREFLTKIFDIVNRKNYDNSDSMIDYFDVGYYTYVSLGSFEKPYVIGTPKVAKKKVVRKACSEIVEAVVVEEIAIIKEEIFEESELDIQNEVLDIEKISTDSSLSDKIELLRLADKYFHLASDATKDGDDEMYELMSSMARECLKTLNVMK